MSGMKNDQKVILVERATNWISKRLSRTDTEQDAYLQGMEDALLAVYQETSDGAYSASTMYDMISELFGDYYDLNVLKITAEERVNKS
jgi:hypothetical protein